MIAITITCISQEKQEAIILSQVYDSSQINLFHRTFAKKVLKNGSKELTESLMEKFNPHYHGSTFHVLQEGKYELQAFVSYNGLICMIAAQNGKLAERQSKSILSACINEFESQYGYGKIQSTYEEDQNLELPIMSEFLKSFNSGKLDNDKLDVAFDKVKYVKNIMHDNVKALLRNTDDLNDLDKAAEEVKENANQFRKVARKKKCCAIF
ncbi:snare protein [Stylonychia lemnae]|uniref:Snare protein n=1 Tax=Stylonychia lemnae TaxID=5949 RepID=A0A077ZRV8_STYLE|nr:snare protein [Stylonychia lemnae]|eukprot:CDW72607.1 snare protein [Stylonychia lemnae]